MKEEREDDRESKACVRGYEVNSKYPLRDRGDTWLIVLSLTWELYQHLGDTTVDVQGKSFSYGV